MVLHDIFLKSKRARAVCAIFCVVTLSLSFQVLVFGSEIRTNSTRVYLSDPGEYLYVEDAAREQLSKDHYYSLDEVSQMLEALDAKGNGKVDFASAAEDVYDWNQSTGADIAAMCALICSENTHNNSHGSDHWNFFVLPASGEMSFYKDRTGRKFWDAKKNCKTIGEALLKGMERIKKNYWENGQDSFYTMAFNQYGYPVNRVQAENSKKEICHSYLPYWEDTAYIASGFDSDHAWVNRMAFYLENFRDEGRRKWKIL